jgi:hypothetical protein
MVNVVPAEDRMRPKRLLFRRDATLLGRRIQCEPLAISKMAARSDRFPIST